MPRNQRNAMGTVEQREKQLKKLYNLIRGDGIQIGVASQSSDFVSFDVIKNKKTIMSFTITYLNDAILIMDENRNIIDRLLPKDKGYNLLNTLLNYTKNIPNIETRGSEKTGLYDGKRFLGSIVPALGKALGGVPRNQQVSESKSTVGTTTLLTQETSSTETVPTTGITSTEGTSTVGTTTLSTETVSHDDPNYIFNIAIESSTEPIENNTSTELFDFASSKAEEKSTTEGIDHTMQEIRESSKYVYPIAPTPLMRQIISNGAFSIGNGTATWINRQTNRTGEVSVFNETSAAEPTAIASTPKKPGMSATEITGWATLGVGLFMLGVGVKKFYDSCCKTSGYGIQDLGSNLDKKDGARLKSRSKLPNTGTEVNPLLPQRSFFFGGVSGQPESKFELVILNDSEHKVLI